MKRFVRIIPIIGFLLVLIFRLRRWLMAHLLGLTSVQNGVMVERDIAITMHDGVRLMADHYVPSGPDDYPTILMRSPYGRSGYFSAFGHLQAFFAYRFAERGYHVLVQDVRGRFESDGEFQAYLPERKDGLETLEWLAEQPWFDGNLALWGASYSGIVQWAMINDTAQVKAIMPVVSASRLRNIVFPDGAFDLGLAIRWMAVFHALDKRIGKRVLHSTDFLLEIERMVQPAFETLPIVSSDMIIFDERFPFFQYWLDHQDPDDEVWEQVFEHVKPAELGIPVHLVGGWYDFFLRGQLKDYADLRDAGRNPYLTIGPWHHFQTLVSFKDLDEGIRWFDAHMKGKTDCLREQPVRIYVMGADKWRDMAEWPPPSQERRLYLRGNGQLKSGISKADSSQSRYTYDPADPTPAVGGTQFSVHAGKHDNSKHECRSDVLTFTTLPLPHDIEVIGPVKVELYAASSLDHTDFYGRMCDVQPDGRSMNICDGLFRVEPNNVQAHEDGIICVEIDLWATAHRFLAGHCIRLQVSSGAHPRWSRNLGTDESIASGVKMNIAHQTIYHDRYHPSALVLPVVEG